MKWLSVKKHKPPLDEVVIVKDKCRSMAFARWNEEYGWLNDWTGMTSEYEVTHFCIPDPIEIEEE